MPDNGAPENSVTGDDERRAERPWDTIADGIPQTEEQAKRAGISWDLCKKLNARQAAVAACRLSDVTTVAQMHERHTEDVVFRLSPDRARALEALAEAEETSVSEIVRAALDKRGEATRLRHVMAAALERTQVDDCGEASMILEAEVNLDGTSAR